MKADGRELKYFPFSRNLSGINSWGFSQYFSSLSIEYWCTKTPVPSGIVRSPKILSIFSSKIFKLNNFSHFFIYRFWSELWPCERPPTELYFWISCTPICMRSQNDNYSYLLVVEFCRLFRNWFLVLTFSELLDNRLIKRISIWMWTEMCRYRLSIRKNIIPKI